MDRTLASGSYPGLPDEAWTADKALSEALDTHACLNLMWRQWDIFRDKLGHSGRNYVSEMDIDDPDSRPFKIDGDVPALGRYNAARRVARYVYLPRLADSGVLVEAVKSGVARLVDAPIAYATGKHPDGHHTGIVLNRLGEIYFDTQSLLVHPDHIILPPEVKPPDPPVGRGEGTQLPPEGIPPVPGGLKPPPVVKVTSRYYGRVPIDAQRVNREIGVIVEEVIQRLTSQVGCDVQITLEISARNMLGFDENTVRTISENSRTLKFDLYEFEEE